MQKTIKQALLASVVLTLGPSHVAAQTPGDRAQLIEERRAAIQERLQQIDPATIEQRRDAMMQRLQGLDTGARLEALNDARADRLAERSAAFDRLATITAADVETRLSDREEQILGRLADADAAAIASRFNERGAEASERLADGEFPRIADENLDALVAAAARAETITASEVEALIADGALEVQDIFDGFDPEAISAQLNDIGAKALDAQDSRRAP